MRARPANLVACTGQSHMTTPAAGPVPSIVRAAFPGTYTIASGRDATSWSQRSSSTKAWEDVDRHVGSVTGRRLILDAGGSTDIVLGLTAAQILTNAEAYWGARVARFPGLAVVACTILPATGYSAGQEAIRLAANDLIRASSLVDAVADWAALPALTDPTNATFYNTADVGLQHMTVAGAVHAGNECVRAIQAVLDAD